MALNAQLALQHAIIWMSFASSFFSVCRTHTSDFYCLKSIMDSMEGPALKYLWDLSSISNSSANYTHHEDSICAFTGVECSRKNNASESKIVHIRLSGMGLEGQFPRGIINCTSLLGLDLSGNKYSGLLPLDISRMIPFVSWLNLSSNNFSGEIPPDIANLRRLKVLKLDHNQLSGEIPTTVLGLLLSRRLVYFSVANNINLSSAGTMPNFVIHANNNQLCGASEECSSNPINKDDHDDDNPFITGFIVGWSISAVLVFAATTLFCMPNISPGKLMTRSKKTKKKRKKKFRKRTKAIRLRRSQKLIIRRRRDLHSKIHTFDKCVTRMTIKYLLKVTDKFSQRNVIGLGKHGTVYRATLGYGNFLAVKRFEADSHQQQQQHFMSEVLTIGRFRQRNLVPLLGFWIERKERLLVYKYWANGSLYDWLHPNNNNNNNPMRAILEWPLRFRISIGIARGLAWLHNRFKYRITHGNICSKSILLDKNLDPKISNFEQAMIVESNRSSSNLRIFVNGESRELDGVASRYECLVEAPKNDVLAFGILLLEVVTGEQPDDLSNMYCQGFCGNFVQWISYHHLDESLVGSGLGLFDGEISQFLQVAFNCIQPCSNERPTMLKVYKTLRAIGVENGNNFVPALQIISNSDIEIVEEME